MNNSQYYTPFNSNSNLILENPLDNTNGINLIDNLKQLFGLNSGSSDLLAPASQYNNGININGGNTNSLLSNFNWGTAMQGLQALSSLWGAYNMGKQYDLAKDQLNFQKDAWMKNYANSVKDYNNLLWDKYRSRGSQESGNTNAYQNEYDKNKL